MSAPPRLARWLLTRRLPPEDREDILLNLEELHRHHARRRGRWFATAWYWRDALVFAVRFGRARGAGGPAPARVGSTFAGAARAFVRAPRHALIATATLGTGIAVVTLVFALAWAAVLRPLPLPEPDRLDWIWTSGSVSVTQRQFATLREAVAGTTELTAFAGRAFALTGVSEPTELNGLAVSANHFRVFGLPPHLGRALRDEDGLPGAEPVVLLSHDLWLRRFGADSAIVGHRIDLYTAAAIPMVAGLGLGAIGVFAVAGAAVAGRQREIGVRLAVGATPGAIARSELGRTGRLAALGVGLGLAGTVAAARLVGGLLYDGAPLDPAVLMSVSALLLAVVGVAVAVPTWRATQVDPTRTLRRDG